jgi:hypothetical protein
MINIIWNIIRSKGQVGGSILKLENENNVSKIL